MFTVSLLLLPLVKGSDVLAALLINAHVQPHEQNLPQTTICRNRPLKEMLRSDICSELSYWLLNCNLWAVLSVLVLPTTTTTTAAPSRSWAAR